MKELKWWTAGLLFILCLLIGCAALALWVRANGLLILGAVFIGLTARLFNWLRANNT